jgi:tetratricopeptide (TPR) repeat protein
MRWGPTVIAILIVLFAAQGLLQNQIDPIWKKNYWVAGELVEPGLGHEQILLALVGFREVLAGILWVRADEFFHQGNYDAILPLVRLVTLLDPHQVDVYVTGAWHMGYNFTDEDQRSDRRYLGPALALLNEGVAKNPGTYELWFELGWMKYHKIEDFPGAVAAFEQAIKYDDIPLARRNILVHAYEKNGDPWAALDYYKKLLALNQKMVDDFPGSDSARVGRDTVEHQLDLHILRMAARGYFAEKRGDYGPAGYYTTLPPLHDMHFGVRVEVPEPGVINVVGTLGLNPIGARVRTVLKDAGYELNLHPREFTFEVDKHVTYMQDSLFNRKSRFARKINMSKDPMMYPFEAKKYDIEFLWSPQWAPAHIQDRLGWNGEGMTDERYLDTSVPGLNRIFCRLTITRDQILRLGEWRDKMPVIETPNFVEVPEPPPRYREVPPESMPATPREVPPSKRPHAELEES